MENLFITNKKTINYILNYLADITTKAKAIYIITNSADSTNAQYYNTKLDTNIFDKIIHDNNTIFLLYSSYDNDDVKVIYNSWIRQRNISNQRQIDISYPNINLINHFNIDLYNIKDYINKLTASPFYISVNENILYKTTDNILYLKTSRANMFYYIYYKELNDFYNKLMEHNIKHFRIIDIKQIKYNYYFTDNIINVYSMILTNDDKIFIDDTIYFPRIDISKNILCKTINDKICLKLNTCIDQYISNKTYIQFPYINDDIKYLSEYMNYNFSENIEKVNYYNIYDYFFQTPNGKQFLMFSRDNTLNYNKFNLTDLLLNDDFTFDIHNSKLNPIYIDVLNKKYFKKPFTKYIYQAIKNT